MTPKVKNQLGFEVLQPSALHDFAWPDADPQLVDQACESWSSKHSDLLDKAVRNFQFDRDKFLAETRSLSVSDRVWRLLTMTAFNFNGVESVRSEAMWQERVAQAVAGGEPIEIAYPLVCKINNPAKRLTMVNATAGERAIVRFFREIGLLVKAMYEPGLRVHVLSDATLYNGALFVPPPTAISYMRDFAAVIESDSAGDFVILHDYSALLSPFYREFESLYSAHYSELSAVPLSGEALGSLPVSVRTNLNSRRLELTFDQMKALFGPRQVTFSATRLDLDGQARYALMEQLAIKMACVDLDLPSRLWPKHVRATCHRGLKDGRAVLGLRCYPEYYGASRLLPYHGMPLIEPGRRGAARLLVLPEVVLRGDPSLVRVINEAGEPVLYVRKK